MQGYHKLGGPWLKPMQEVQYHQQPTFCGWFIESIHGDFGDGFLLGLPLKHQIPCLTGPENH